MKFMRVSLLALVALTYTFSLAVRAQAQTFTTLAGFNGLNGSGPFASVVQAADGNFYGVTTEGGPNPTLDGTFFRITPEGKLTDIHNFCSLPNCADGTTPVPAPVLGPDGNLYGAASGGISSATAPAGGGIIYRITTGGKLTTLHDFCATDACTDGNGPTGLVLGGDGNFYGTTSVAPNLTGDPGGTIFSISPTGEYKLLYAFCSRANCLDGEFPFYPPIFGSDGNLYGVTFEGGNQGGGVLYELTSSGTYKVLYNFCRPSGECGNSNPFLIVREFKGNFFGTTQYGAAQGSGGTLFELTSKGRFRVLHNFDVSNDWPTTGLTLTNDGSLYGVSNYNSIFKVTASGAFTTVYTLATADGFSPVGPLFQGTDGSLYGTTVYGPGNSQGSVFKISDGLKSLVETVPTAGKVGKRILILGNHLTGTTSVTFNGVPGEFKVHKDTFITAWVPTGATTGIVSVVTPSGTLNSNPQFVVTK